MQSSEKLKTALQNMAAAEKALKTSMFKWSPDFDTAASEYTKAATNFKLGGSAVKAKDAYIKASEMQEKLSSLFHAAKLLTQAAGIASDMKRLEEAVSLMQRACSLYREHGAPDTAALTISKAAKMCETGLPNKATEMYLTAAELCEMDEKLRDAADHLNNAVRMEVKQNKYNEACKIMKDRMALMKRLNNPHVGHQITLCMVIVGLATGDFKVAETAYKEGFDIDRFGESDEAMYSEQFLKSYEEGDDELLTKTKSAPMVKFLDTEIARLAKTLTMDGVKNVPSKHDVGGKDELEQYEETLENENQKTPSETTETTIADAQQNDGEDEDLSMLC